jgi:hypothetical protein
MPLYKMFLEKVRNNDITLASLNIHYQRTSDVGTKGLSDALIYNSAIISLDLEGNLIGAAGEEA